MTPTVSDRTTSAWDRIEERAADHACREAARNAPKAAAIRAVYTLSSTFGELGAEDRHDVFVLLVHEVLAVHKVS